MLERVPAAAHADHHVTTFQQLEITQIIRLFALGKREKATDNSNIVISLGAQLTKLSIDNKEKNSSV